MTDGERRIITMLDRLFWLVTQAPGVARYADDVELFTRAAMDAGSVTQADGERLINDYKKDRG